MKWHRGLPLDWDAVPEIPPILVDDVDVESVPSGVVFRDGQAYVCALDEDDVLDLEQCR